MKFPRSGGFTLIELIVVVLVVAILLTLTLPAYQQQLRATRRSLAGAALLEAMVREEQYFLQHQRYAGDLTDLDYPAQPFAIDTQGNTLSGDAPHRLYLINLTTRANTFTLSAAPQLGQAKDSLCGTLSVDSSGAKHTSGSGTLSQCW
jgi:type IV pilus assembly protein PilE